MVADMVNEYSIENKPEKWEVGFMDDMVKKYLILILLIGAVIAFGAGCTKTEEMKVTAAKTESKESVSTSEKVSSEEDVNTSETVSSEEGVNTSETVSSEESENTAKTVETGDAVYVPETVIDMIPIDTDLDGLHNGYFVVTIDGKKYRYKMASAQNESVTVGDMIYKWENKGNEFKFYAVKEHPDLKLLKCNSTENGIKNDFLIAYAPPSGLPEGSLDEIINDGFVVMKNGSVISGEDKWQEFVKKTEAKEPAEINIAYYYTLTGRMAKNLYEMSKMDYPVVYLHRLKYDGESFIFSPLQKSDVSDSKYEIMPDNENEWEQKFKYMKHYTEKAPNDTALFSAFDKYVLVDDDTKTWEDIWNATIGLAEGFWHAEVFNKYDYKDGANPDELTTIDIDF